LRTSGFRWLDRLPGCHQPPNSSISLCVDAWDTYCVFSKSKTQRDSADSLLNLGKTGCHLGTLKRHLLGAATEMDRGWTLTELPLFLLGLSQSVLRTQIADCRTRVTFSPVSPGIAPCGHLRESPAFRLCDRRRCARGNPLGPGPEPRS
jgi:hypothetical protein